MLALLVMPFAGNYHGSAILPTLPRHRMRVQTITGFWLLLVTLCGAVLGYELADCVKTGSIWSSPSRGLHAQVMQAALPLSVLSCNLRIPCAFRCYL